MKNYRLKMLFVTVLAFILMSNTLVFASADPFDTPDYDNVGQGEDYNYNESEDGELTADVSINVNPNKSFYEPGEVVELLITIKAVAGSGDGDDGQEGIRDILLEVFDDYSNHVYFLTEGELTEITPAKKAELDPNLPASQTMFVDVPQGDTGVSFTYNYTIPADATPGNTYNINYQVYDYGIFSYEEIGTWMHADTKSGIVPLTIGQTPPPPPPPPSVTYSVDVVTNPAGVPASFSGEGINFDFGDPYAVELLNYDTNNWVFDGFSDPTEGTITEDVFIVANFVQVEEETFTVTAVSVPAGVATFEGTGSDLANGTDYSVSIASVTEGYTFVEWQVSPSGTINNADVEVIAVFEEDEVEEEILDEDVAEDLPDEPLPEAGGIPLVAFSSFGLALSALGAKIRKK